MAKKTFLRIFIGSLIVALFISPFMLEAKEAPASQKSQKSQNKPLSDNMPKVGMMHPNTFADLADRLLPAVVNISTKQIIEPPEAGGRSPNLPPQFQFPPGSPFEDFFKDFFGENFPPQGIPQQRQAPRKKFTPERKATSLGSGFIISPKGFVVTNNHVIAEADEITVTLSDDTQFPAKVIGKDPKTDVALLKIESKTDLPYVEFGDSDKARVGEWILAIGNPFGLGGTVTAGIISARARDINAGPYDDFIQTDASINRGNSGGPLFDLNGKVIGINTAIFSPTGGSVGIGFSIPSNLAKPVLDQLKDFGRTKRGWLGVRIQEVTEELAESLGLDKPRGALVAGVSPKGPSAAAGVQAGDVILEFNGQNIAEMRELPRVVASTKVGSKVKVVLLRKGKKKTVRVNLGELEKAEENDLLAEESIGIDNDEGDADGAPKTTGLLGLELAPLTKDLRERYALSEAARGVLVIDLDESSEAAEKGVRPGNVISQANYENIRSPQEFKAQVSRLKKQSKSSILLRVLSANSSPRFVVLSIEEPKAKDDGKDGAKDGAKEKR